MTAFLGRPETDVARVAAMTTLGNGLLLADHHEDALPVYEAELSMWRRFGFGVDEKALLITKTNIALCYYRLGRHEEALNLRRQVYARGVALGISNKDLFIDVLNLSWSLNETGRYTEAKSFLREQLPKARRVLGVDHDTVIQMRWQHAETLRLDGDASREDLVEAVTVLEELSRKTQRIYGTSHPLPTDIRTTLGLARKKLAAFDTSK